jgi:predicted glycoside hydrolase/deacetylase ChbG (UPF0249 family)
MKMNLSNRLLGYADDARLLIINADDLGMSYTINDAIFRTLKAGLVRSTSLMVPWPAALNALQFLKQNPDIPFGVHLSVINDNPGYRWKPLLPTEQVPSLVDADGYFHTEEHMSAFLALARVDELEPEFRAQIEVVMAAGLQPTHLDWHCLHNGGRADILDLTVRLGKEYGMAVRVYQNPVTEQLQREGLPTNDHDLMDSYDVEINAKSATYARMLRELPAGVTEWAVHPGLENAEMRTIEPESWQVRTSDFDFLMSPQARELIDREGIILLDYKQFQTLWQAKQSSV